jgi:hypothetical protein
MIIHDTIEEVREFYIKQEIKERLKEKILNLYRPRKVRNIMGSVFEAYTA